MDSKKWNIKILQLEDFDDFYQLFKKSVLTQFPEYNSHITNFLINSPYSKDELKRQIITSEKDIYLALDTTKLIGYLIAEKSFGGVGMCEWLGVDNEYQNKGVGTSLLRHYEANLKEEGGHKVQLWSADTNIAYYQKKGYTLAGKIPSHWFGEDDYILYKILQEPKEENYLRQYFKTLKQ